MEGFNSSLNSYQINLQELVNINQNPNSHMIHEQQPPTPDFDPTFNEDFLEQIFSNLLSSFPWVDFNNDNTNKHLWDPNSSTSIQLNEMKPFDTENIIFPNDNLSSQFCNQQINANFPTTKTAHILPRNDFIDPNTLKSLNFGGEASASVQPLFNGFSNQVLNQPQYFQHPQGQSLGGGEGAMNQAPAASNPIQAKPRVRARRGQATDPHSIAERLRRERIAERMKALQELVPNAYKLDKALMLDEIIDYVKFLQNQVKVLSMARSGGASVVAPMVADLSAQFFILPFFSGGGDCFQTTDVWALRQNLKSNQMTESTSNESLTMIEHKVAKLMEEDMGSAMQYLQSKGLCLMPISLTTTISTSTYHTGNPLINANNKNIGDGPSSFGM